MQIELQVSMACETLTIPDKYDTDEDPSQISSSLTHAAHQKPAKKQTRQWAAWTRQEEESFFSALRLVGKNFEKITCRVPSKNKDQVRHYYYRLLRRMNKLLGPDFYLDAKNSKETTAAMLRWWSLLEKYSCKASKLHLKPRRFKIFIDALELQLLKDRKKNIKKRPAGENCCLGLSTTVSNHSRLSGNDNRAAKLVLVESQNQNIQKSGPEKASLVKRNINLCVNRNNNKGDSSSGKTTRQRAKPASLVSSAAYKRWEKAATAGVSLVADAAEHLERTTTDSNQGRDGFDPATNNLPPLPKNFLQYPFAGSNDPQLSMKLKLQLFPIDDATRVALEMDKHNPHLELTLSRRKKISSVLDHLNRKWGDTSVAFGELTLFPYSVQKENLGTYQRWAQNSVVSVADIYSMIGSPIVFRLRYGWMSINELSSAKYQEPLATWHVSEKNVMNMNIEHEKVVEPRSMPASLTGLQSGNVVDSLKDKTKVTENTYSVSSSSNNTIIFSDPAANISWHNNTKQSENSNYLKSNHTNAMSAGEWADTLLNTSVGDLLPEASDKMDRTLLCHQPIPFSCDSFDAAIAAHISRHQPVRASCASSIWDGEEACNAFSFHKTCNARQEFPDSSRTAFSGASDQMNSTNCGGLIDKMLEEECLTDDPAHEDPMDDECHFAPQALENTATDFAALTDMYWPDSLGPLDLLTASPRFHGDDLLLSDSLNHLIATSLDAFQNCSFYGG